MPRGFKGFQKGHPTYLSEHSEETKKRISETHKGVKQSEEHRKRSSEARKGMKLPEEWIKHSAAGHRGLKRSEETKKRMSDAKKGKVFTEEHKKKLSEARIGRVPWNKGGKMPEKFREGRKGMGNPAWEGGKSFGAYTLDWTRTLKRSIRERDKYTCQICGELQSDTAFSIHHIDYNKENCNPENLVTLCKSCHTKTNFNRKYWIERLNIKRA